MLCNCSNYPGNYTLCTSTALNGSSEILCFEYSDSIEIHDGIFSAWDCHMYHINTPDFFCCIASMVLAGASHSS